MMKKLTVLGILLLILLGSTYTIGAQFYSQRYLANTQFATIDIGNLTKEEASEKIQQEINEASILLEEEGQVLGTIHLADVGPDIQVESHLDDLLKEQAQDMWLVSYFNATDYTPAETADYISIEPENLKHATESIELNNEARKPSQDASITYSPEAGFYIEVEEQGNQVNQAELIDHIRAEVQKGSTTIDVKEAYIQADVLATDDILTHTLTQLSALEQTQITLLIAGEEEVIDPNVMMDWVLIDDDSQVYFDEESIYEYLGTLNDLYATYDDYRYFESTLQGEVQLLPGTLGWSIDREAETQAILADLYAGVNITREPAIVGVGYNGTLDDIGSSYIEVDILNQSMFVYIEGEQVISTPIVTGQIGTDTIPGAYSIWNIESPSQLVGYNPWTEQDYVQPVQYWLAFDDTGQGIHDANWQPYFGGDAYLNNGSLGCINTPPDVMASVFNYADAGMPVIVFE